MPKFYLVLCCLLAPALVFTQDFSNKGKEFWIAYGNHVRMFEVTSSQNPAQQMQLYMTSDVSTTGTVEIPGTGFTQSFSITADQITTVDIPNTAALLDEGTYNLGIHVTSQKPIVVYSFIYVNAVSGATLCLPVATLGRAYFSVNYLQISNQPNSYSYFDVIATDTGTTTVEIIPNLNTKGGHLAGVPYTVNLTRGQVYQVLGQATTTVNPYRGTDLTGSQIRSISTSTTKCKRIAVFSGSGKISIGCSGSGTSDNLYQQMYPVSTWGKTYITVPSISRSSTVSQYNFFRIFKSDPSAVVTMNGSALPQTAFVGNYYYEFNSNQPSLIESDKPILVAQYLTTSGCNSNNGQGDPEMIYLNPVEQTIANVTLNSMQPAINTNINEHHLNVVLKNIPSVIGSFKVDGAPVGGFTPLAANSSYAYAQLTVSKGTHTLTCDSGFNAIAYGFGSAESYGYSAGTNLKDLYQFVSIKNQYAVVNFPAGCKSSPFKFSMTFPYQPVSIRWLFKGLFSDTLLARPVFDSSWTVNGRTLYRYSLNRNYQINTTGTYPITVVADNPTSDGCSGEQEIDYDLQIFDRPLASFNITQSGCLSDAVNFTDSTNGSGRPVINWAWNFGDGELFSGKSPKHVYKAPGTFTVAFSSITDVGCVSDTMTKTLALTEQPVAKFMVDGAACINRPVTMIDQSTPSGGQLVKWKWNFGDNTISDLRQPGHTYLKAGDYIITLDVESASGCKSTVSKTIRAGYTPVPDFGMPAVCLSDPFARFFDSTKTLDPSPGQSTYAWNFGDASNVATNLSSVKDPTHRYLSVGNYVVSLKVTSPDGCTADTVKTITVNGSTPKAVFDVNVASMLCSNLPVTLTDRSTVDFGKITRVEIFWDYANDPTVKTVDDLPVQAKTYAHQYPLFGTPLTKNVQVLYVVYSGVSCVNQESRNISLQASPAISFEPVNPVCQEVAGIQLKAGKEVNGISGTGSWSGKGISLTGVFSPKIAGAGLDSVKFTYTTTVGCVTEATQIIRVMPSPLANAGADIHMLEGSVITIPATATASAVYLWSPTVAMDNDKILTPKISPVADITYHLTVTSTDGCTASDDVSVFVLKAVKVPNAFSPNGDGINDSWKIENLGSYPGATVDVYNRYGQLVFHTVGYNKEWKGDLNGNPLPLGTYYWIISPKNGRVQMNGSVTLVR